MIVYFADRIMNILGSASTSLPKGLTITEDKKTEEIETGVAVFECTIPYDSETLREVEVCTAVGNYILRSDDGENEFYTIIETEKNTNAQEIYLYAEDAGMDLLNEIVGDYAASEAYPISHYINKFANDTGFVIGVNEAEGLNRKLSWEGEATAAARIASVATQFDNCEVSYSFDAKGLQITNKYINIYKKRGKDAGVQLRLNRDVNQIVTKKSIADLATSLQVTGGTPEDSEDPITLKGYEYDDGDMYVTSGGRLNSRNALTRWSRYVWEGEPNQQAGYTGHIIAQYSYDTTSQSELCNRAVSHLKEVCEVAVNYEIELSRLPDNVKIGDTVYIIDEQGELFLSSRVLKLETSRCNNTQAMTLGEYLIKSSGISEKVTDLAEQFAENAQSAKRAIAIANAAKDAAGEASEDAAANAENISAASLGITQLTESFSNLVTGANDESLMTQTEDGWVFNFAEYQKAISDAADSIAGLSSSASVMSSKVDILNQTVENLGEYTDYIHFGTENEKPCIILGETDSEFKVIITNTEIRFMEGSATPASISNETLNIEKAEIKEELRQGSFAWVARSNGNYGLVWKGDE